MKFGVGVMLSAVGVFWTGEGLGIIWPGSDFAIVIFAAVFAATGLGLAAILRRPAVGAAQVTARVVGRHIAAPAANDAA